MGGPAPPKRARVTDRVSARGVESIEQEKGGHSPPISPTEMATREPQFVVVDLPVTSPTEMDANDIMDIVSYLRGLGLDAAQVDLAYKSVATAVARQAQGARRTRCSPAPQRHLAACLPAPCRRRRHRIAQAQPRALGGAAPVAERARVGGLQVRLGHARPVPSLLAGEEGAASASARRAVGGRLPNIFSQFGRALCVQ